MGKPPKEMEPPNDSGNSTLKTKHTWYTNLKFFLVALSFSFFAKTLAGSYMKSSITQIERRFGIPSSFIGFIDGSFEMGNLLVITVVSYLGAKHHRPKLIAAGLVTMAIGTFITALPHFIMGRYDYETGIKSSYNSTTEMSFCNVDGNSKLSSESPETSSLASNADCEKATGSLMWIYVLLGNVLRGVGEAPTVPLGISYLADYCKEENLPFYLGCIFTIALIGPIFGFLLGSFCARLYVDIGFVSQDRLTITQNDARWVGAWWLGYLVAGVILIIAAIPFYFFPKSLPSKRVVKKVKKSIVQTTEETQSKSDHSSTVTEMAKGFMPALKQLFYSPIFILYGVSTILDVSAWIGLMTFKPKFIEQQYGQSTSTANLLIGTVNIPALAFGIFLSGIVMKKFKLDLKGTAKFYFLTNILAWFLHISVFALGCKNNVIAGITTSYEGIRLDSYNEHHLISDCNADCTCSKTQWEPVCAVNGMTYISPCLAGCKTTTGTGLKTEFHNCNCTFGSRPDNSSVILGQCQRSDGCDKTFLYFMIITGISSFVNVFGNIPKFVMLLRSVNPELKSLTIGILTLFVRIFGGIPVPIYFGALIDMTCLKWEFKKCDEPGACRIYNSDNLRWVYNGAVVGLQGLSFLFYLPIFLQLKKHFPSEKDKAADQEMPVRNQEGNPTDYEPLMKKPECIIETHL